jgi:hypothetical protein
LADPSLYYAHGLQQRRQDEHRNVSSQRLILLEPAPALPEGLQYRADLISPAEEAALIKHIAVLPFRPFEFHGYLGNRRTVSFGFRYDYGDRAVHEAEPIPAFRLRRKDGNKWQRAALDLAPRSVYLLRSAVRYEWQHSIAAMAELRYSVTFRSRA